MSLRTWRSLQTNHIGISWGYSFQHVGHLKQNLTVNLVTSQICTFLKSSCIFEKRIFVFVVELWFNLVIVFDVSFRFFGVALAFETICDNMFSVLCPLVPQLGFWLFKLKMKFQKARPEGRQSEKQGFSSPNLGVSEVLCGRNVHTSNHHHLLGGFCY